MMEEKTIEDMAEAEIIDACFKPKVAKFLYSRHKECITAQFITVLISICMVWLDAIAIIQACFKPVI